MNRSSAARTTALALLIIIAGRAGGTPVADTDQPTETTATGSSTTTTAANGTLEVHFINVGQSVSAPVVGPTGETMLIDTGHYRDDGEYVLQ